MAQIVSQYSLHIPVTSTGFAYATGVPVRLAGSARYAGGQIIGLIYLDTYNRVTVNLNDSIINDFSRIYDGLSVNSLMAELSGGVDTSIDYTKTQFESIMNAFNFANAVIVKDI